MKKPTEQDLVRQLLEYLRLRGIPAWRINTTGIKRRDRSGREFWAFAGTRGVADIAGVIPPAGRALWIEAKVRPNRPTLEQTAFLERVNAARGLGLVAYDLDDLREALEGHR